MSAEEELWRAWLENESRMTTLNIYKVPEENWETDLEKEKNRMADLQDLKRMRKDIEKLKSVNKLIQRTT